MSSTVIAKNIQIGTSGTATNNFNWYQPAAPDGTVRLGVGNYGATTLDAITVANTGNVTLGGTTTLTNVSYTGTLTGGTGIVNLGSGQFYKDASGNVGIGTSSPPSASGYTILALNNATNGGSMRLLSNETQGLSLSVDGSNAYIDEPRAVPVRTFVNGAERMRITSGGNVGINTTSPTARLSVSGGISYEYSSIGGFGLNNIGVYSFNNNSANSIGSGANAGFVLVTINQGNNITAIPIFANAGGGVAWTMSVFDPDSGTFAYGAGPSVSFATAGSSANSYTLSISSGTAAMTIQRTAGSSAYTVAVQIIAG